MSLETGEEQQVVLHLSRSLSWSDFIEKTRFTFMYDGQIHSDVAPVIGGSGVRIDGDDGELLIDIPEWAVPISDFRITLEIGHKDWVLLGITYDDRYQLKPQDLVGLVLPTTGSNIANAILSGNETPLVFNGHLLTIQYDSANSTAVLKLNRCSESDQNCVQYGTNEHGDQDHIILTSYSCAAPDSNLAQFFKNYMEDNIGLQPSQIATVTFGDLQTQVKLPIGGPSY